MNTVTIESKEIGIVRVALKAIEKWPYWDSIQEVCKKEYGVTTERFHTLLPEYQRFMALVAGYGSIGMCSTEVDLIWHSHILYTRLYTQFCEQIYGRFIHHEPNLKDSANESCTSPDDVCTGGRCLSKCQTPPPKCKSSEEISTKVDFAQAYRAAFSRPPGAIWNLTRPGGQTT